MKSQRGKRTTKKRNLSENMHERMAMLIDSGEVKKNLMGMTLFRDNRDNNATFQG